MRSELAMMISGTLLFGGLMGALGWQHSRSPLGDDPKHLYPEGGAARVATAGEAAPLPTPTPAAKLPLDDQPYLATMAAADIYPVRDWNVPELTLTASSVAGAPSSAAPLRTAASSVAGAPSSADISNQFKISASSSLVMLADQEKVLFEKAGHERLPIASITKLLTALTALEAREPETILTISPEAVAEEGESALLPNERFTLAQLILFTLLPSSNDAAKELWLSLGREEFTTRMNEKARVLGMRDSRFTNASGLDGGEQYSTAFDVVLLTKAVLRQEFLVRSMALPNVTVTSQGGRTVTLQNSNKLLGKVKGVLLGKTGFTGEARQSLVTVTEEGPNREHVIFVVLGSNDRFGDMTKLIEWTRRAYKF